MAEVTVEGLSEWEGAVIVVDRAVDTAITGSDVLVLEPGEKFLLVPETLSSTCWLAIPVFEVVENLTANCQPSSFRSMLGPSMVGRRHSK